MDKLNKLKAIIKKMDSVVVAFSGGVDSAFLLKVASLVLPKDKVLAVTAISPTYPKEELLNSRDIAKHLGIRHKVIKTYEFKDKRFVSNPVNRCYFCKQELFSKLKHIASQFQLNFVLDASTVSDESDFRPGNAAKKELRIHSPLIEANFSKEDIRKLSKSWGLNTWDKPSLACLASRIPYGTKITQGALKRINQGEAYLRRMGFKQVRLRHYNELCRIEVLKQDIPSIIIKRNRIIDKLKKLGYNYITLDLQGYRTGSMNEVLRRDKK